MAELEINGVSYHYRSWGTGQPVLLLHGFTGCAGAWEDLARACPLGSLLVAPDLLGHGATAAPADPERYAMHWAAADLLALLDILGLPQVDLLGYSMGGRLGLYFALQHPQRVRRLVLESASPGLESEAERQARRQSDAALARRIESQGITAFVDEWELLPLFASQQALPAAVRQAQRAQRLANRPLGLANSLRGMGTGAQPNLWPALAGLTLPVLLITGALDDKFCAIGRRMVDLLPQAQLVVVPGAGHTPHLERLAAMAKLLSLFFTNPVDALEV